MSEILNSRRVATRKDHVCFGCGRKFPAGTAMTVDVVIDDGIWNCYLCDTCKEITLDMEPWDEFGHGDLRDEALEREARSESDQNDNVHCGMVTNLRLLGDI